MKSEDTEPQGRRARTNDDENANTLAGARTLQSIISELRNAVNECKRCSLWKSATQGVPGEGLAPSKLWRVLIEKGAGDSEDLQGHPFVGPAGSILDRALQDAGLSRQSVYVSNAVKHFKFEARGKRRLHIKPAASEIEACGWWLTEELRACRTCFQDGVLVAPPHARSWATQSPYRKCAARQHDCHRPHICG